MKHIVCRLYETNCATFETHGESDHKVSVRENDVNDVYFALHLKNAITECNTTTSEPKKYVLTILSSNCNITMFFPEIDALIAIKLAIDEILEKEGKNK